LVTLICDLALMTLHPGRGQRRRVAGHGGALVASVALLLGAAVSDVAPAFADVVDDGPAAISSGPGSMAVYARGPDGAIYSSSRVPAGWTTWSSLGGTFDSGPGVAVYGGGAHVFARGLEGSEWHWGTAGWHSIGGAVTSAPAATQLRGTDQLWVFVRGADYAIWYSRFSPASGWTPWESLGGSLGSGPAVVSRADGIIDLFARNTNGEVVQRTWFGDHWTTDWYSLGDYASAAPAVTTHGPDNVEVFVRGREGELWRKTWTPAGWSGWTRIDPTVLNSAPAAATEGPGRISVFARLGNSIAVNQLEGGAWSGWRSLAPVSALPSACVAPPTPAGDVRLSAAFVRHRKARIRRAGRSATVAHGVRMRVRGRLTTADGHAMPGAAICIGARVATPGSPLTETSAMTDANGEFAYDVPRGPSRELRFRHRTPVGAVTAADLRLGVRAGVRLKPSRRVLRNGRRLVLRGRLGAGPYPRAGVLVELQNWRPETRRWHTFATTHASRRGRFRLRYRFTRTFRPQRYKFRARIPSQSTYPYASGASRTVRVRVRP
jgi:hypothetical protein